MVKRSMVRTLHVSYDNRSGEYLLDVELARGRMYRLRVPASVFESFLTRAKRAQDERFHRIVKPLVDQIAHKLGR